MNKKILTYLNFAIKAGELVYGIDNIKSEKKQVCCVLIDKTIPLTTLAKPAQPIKASITTINANL